MSANSDGLITCSSTVSGQLISLIVLYMVISQDHLSVWPGVIMACHDAFAKLRITSGVLLTLEAFVHHISDSDYLQGCLHVIFQYLILITFTCALSVTQSGHIIVHLPGCFSEIYARRSRLHAMHSSGIILQIGRETDVPTSCD